MYVQMMQPQTSLKVVKIYPFNLRQGHLSDVTSNPKKNRSRQKVSQP